jgi:hypothetical protein
VFVCAHRLLKGRVKQLKTHLDKEAELAKVHRGAFPPTIIDVPALKDKEMERVRAKLTAKKV